MVEAITGMTRTYTFVFDPDPEGGFARRGKLSKPPRSFSPALALQRDALAEAGCGRVFIEQMSGAVTDRPALNDALEFARGGDVPDGARGHGSNEPDFGTRRRKHLL